MAGVLTSPKGNRLSAGEDANRRAPRVFAPAPESHAMGGSSQGVPPPKTQTAPKRSMGGMGAGGRMRNRAPLRLLSSLRGTGTLSWDGGSLPATYELDVFSAGETHLATGTLEGEFSALSPIDEGEPFVGEVRLTLADGRQIEVELVHIEPGGAEFEARRPSDIADLSPAPHASHKG